MGCFYIMMDGIVLLNVMHENENYDPDSPVAMNRRKNFPVTIDELSGGYSFGVRLCFINLTFFYRKNKSKNSFYCFQGDTEDHVRKHTVVCKTAVSVLLLENDVSWIYLAETIK